ncbi:hypothetical protein IID24_03275 [Patescibacteria group bacterium]|nr:hypothetical protein [Patescibacteria group bacterium]
MSTVTFMLTAFLIYAGLLLGSIIGTATTKFVPAKEWRVLLPFAVSGWRDRDGFEYRINWTWENIDFSQNPRLGR